MNCKVCGETVYKFTNSSLNMLVPKGFPLSGELTLNFCKQCQFVSNVSPSTQEDYVEYYTKLNKHQVRDGDLLEIDKSYFSDLITFISDNSDFSFLDSKILDFGSGALLFSDLAKAAGADQALNFDIGLSKIGDVKYDLIVSTHTFEHLLDPAKVFEDLLAQLTKNGHIAIAVPDFSTYDDVYYGPFSNFDLEHINHFSTPALVALFEKNQIDILAVRNGERRVSPTLAYSEVLLIGKRSSGIPSKKFEVTSFSAEHKLQTLFGRYEADFKGTMDGFDELVKESRSSGKSKIGLYGLSSHAFRLLFALKQIDQLSAIDFYGDSDSRLSEFGYGSSPILKKDEFFMYVKQAIDEGFAVYVIIFAINSYRILEMFSQELAIDGLRVVALPPDSQNRKDF
jgi:hypothetical protein